MFNNLNRVRLLYSSATIVVLILITVISVTLLTSDAGKKWLDSFSENGDCERVDRPYWCEL